MESEKRIYSVLIQEIHYSHRLVEATSENEAIDLAEDEEESYIEYSHTTDKSNWKVEIAQ